MDRIRALTDGLGHHITEVIDHVGVVARAAHQGIRAGDAIQVIRAGVADEVP